MSVQAFDNFLQRAFCPVGKVLKEGSVISLSGYHEQGLKDLSDLIVGALFFII